ncbi:hypothetical protein BLNAU_2023 [Blattamonas nauphoetae]|uniref:Uncharacterized protein n=1 Tax=Blattamonas nauphoetae TaxID=2049346 RepID=A0ABQ9YGY4_9EUKA|nr:hypothetical protein BLNAU_2023 [Blattamonas nauphoetae]
MDRTSRREMTSSDERNLVEERMSMEGIEGSEAGTRTVEIDEGKEEGTAPLAILGQAILPLPTANRNLSRRAPLPVPNALVVDARTNTIASINTRHIDTPHTSNGSENRKTRLV